MDLGDIIIIGGVLLSGIFSAIGAKKKKAASAKMRTALGDQARSLKRAAPINPAAAPQVATGLPKSVKMPAASQPRTPPSLAEEAGEVGRLNPAVPEPAYAGTPEGTRRRARWTWKQAVIAQTLLGPPRALEGWPGERERHGH